MTNPRVNETDVTGGCSVGVGRGGTDGMALLGLILVVARRRRR
jgi:MYXO-CTERM domain-containing protein